MKKKRPIKKKRIPKVKRNANNVSTKVAKLPVRKKAEKSPKKTGILSKIDRFFKEAKTEIVKVKWPSQKELIVATIAVIIISLGFAFFLGVVDIGIIKLLKIIIQ